LEIPLATGETSAKEGIIRSFSCQVVVRGDDCYVVGPSDRMCRFFGTTPSSYGQGIVARIDKDISPQVAATLRRALREHARTKGDFSFTYPSQRADGSPCTMRLDAFGGRDASQGVVFDVIETDVSDLVEAKEKASNALREKVDSERGGGEGEGELRQGAHRHDKRASFDVAPAARTSRRHARANHVLR
jgi:hypothetical protein